MKVSLNWIKDFVNIKITPEELAHRLTMSGLEVEGLEQRGHSLEGIIAVRILSVDKHPNADKLSICLVDTGRDEERIVCGAPNLSVGSLIPLAPPGTKLPGGMIIKKTRIRGELSMGMLLAEDELDLTDDHSGIMILTEELTPGMALNQALPLEDYTLEIGLTPNRPDCASVVGIAREIAALTGEALKIPAIQLVESGPPIEELTSVLIEDPEGCPRYTAGIIRDFEIGPSPFWLRYRLFQSGLRSINNVVDVTNYVMLELGQPLHAFDCDRLRENRIVVRRAKSGETFTTLDGNSHHLHSDHLMICDGEGSVALAGIMGGFNSEILKQSRNVLLESACFEPRTIRRGSKRLGLSTEASYRFERGTDVEGTVFALKRTMMLINHLAGGYIAQGIIDQYPTPYQKRRIELRVEKANQHLGTAISEQEMITHLQALEMIISPQDEGLLIVEPPSFRVDITREVDLFEEIARMEGYDNIRVTVPHIRPNDQIHPRELQLEGLLKEIMVGLGFSEIITYSFISPDFIDWLGVNTTSPLRSLVKLLNPLTREQSVMRTSLIPGLLMTMKNNMAYGDHDLKMFEIGKVFLSNAQEKLPQEKPCLTALMTGLAVKKTWYDHERLVDFYDIKGIVETLFEGLHIPEYHLQTSNLPAYLKKERGAEIVVHDHHLGYLGQISDLAAAHYDLEGETAYMLEIDLEELEKARPVALTFESFTRYPAVFRDITIILDKDIESRKVNEAILQFETDLIESVTLFDHYVGDRIAPHEKALTFRLSYRSEDRTLSGKEINELHEAITQQIGYVTGGRLKDG